MIPFATNFHWFLLQFLKEVQTYLDDWKKSVSSREGFEKHEQKKMMLSAETRCAIQILSESGILCMILLAIFGVVSSFTEFLPYIFKIKEVTCFLSEKLSQDPLEKFFGCQRQKGRANENPTAGEFLKNTQSLRVINSINIKEVTGQLGNCRGTKRKDYDLENPILNMPLKKRKRRHSQ